MRNLDKDKKKEIIIIFRHVCCLFTFDLDGHCLKIT